MNPNTGKLTMGKFAYPKWYGFLKNIPAKILDFPAFLHNVEPYKYFFVSLFLFLGNTVRLALDFAL